MVTEGVIRLFPGKRNVRSGAPGRFAAGIRLGYPVVRSVRAPFYEIGQFDNPVVILWRSESCHALPLFSECARFEENRRPVGQIQDIRIFLFLSALVSGMRPQMQTAGPADVPEHLALYGFF